jgi:hypothetical protein
MAGYSVLRDPTESIRIARRAGASQKCKPIGFWIFLFAIMILAMLDQTSGAWESTLFFIRESVTQAFCRSVKSPRTTWRHDLKEKEGKGSEETETFQKTMKPGPE